MKDTLYANPRQVTSAGASSLNHEVLGAMENFSDSFRSHI